MNVCETCKKTFSTKQNLKVHGKSCKGQEYITPYRCDFCLKYICTKHKLNCHLETCKDKPLKKEVDMKTEIRELKETILELKETIKNSKPTHITTNNDNRVTNNTVVNNLIIAGAEPLDLSLERFLRLADKNYTYDTLAKFRIFKDLIKPFYSNEQGKVVAVLSDIDRMKIKCLDMESNPVAHSPEDISAMLTNDIVLNKTDEYISKLKEEDMNLALKCKDAITDSKKLKRHLSNNKSSFLKKNVNIRFLEN